MKIKIKDKVKLLSLKKYIKENKKKSLLFTLIFIGLIYLLITIFSGNGTVNRYVISAVNKGDIVSTVSASGQVSATNQVDLKSKNSGDIISVNVVTGQQVKAGAIIAQVEAKDAWYAYKSALISYQKLVKPADSVSVIQSENSLDNAKNSLDSYYTEAVTDIDNIFIDMPKIIDGLNAMYYTSSGSLNAIDETSLSTTARAYKSEAGANFDKARKDFESNFINYKTNNVQSSHDDIKKLIDSTYTIVLSMNKAVKGTKNTLDYLQNSNNGNNALSIKNLTSSQLDVNNWLTQLNSHLNKLVNVKNNIYSADKTITEKQISLQDVQDGADALDIESARLSLQQKASTYGDSIIKAPFDGVIAKVSVKKGDNVSSGVSISTIITKQKIITIDLNEVDISKVKVGQSANITFDAIDELTATGTVVSVDGIGTVTQGVVSYNVKIVLNTEDDRILSGMSSSVIIDVDTKHDVLAVETSAVKTQGNRSYVEVFNGVLSDTNTKTPLVLDTKQIEKKFVKLGLSDDFKTEIISGLNEGENVIVKTISTKVSTTKTSTTPSLLGGSTSGGTRLTGATSNFNKAR